MGDHGLLKGDFIEFGAGKAGLSSFIAESALKGSTFVVVEREARRQKKDKDIRACGHDFQRITMDIKDFDLGWFQDKSVIAVAKHLCGGATDLAIRSLTNCKTLLGLAVATCCHHNCDMQSYVNLEFMRDELGIKTEVFQAFVKCASYASLVVASTETRQAGFMVKRMIDLGRLLWIRSQLNLSNV